MLITTISQQRLADDELLCPQLRALQDRIQFRMPQTSPMDSMYFCQLRDAASLRKSFQLRFRVYCQERAYIPAHACQGAMETDAYDHQGGCIHLGAYDRDDNLAGTVRLIVSDCWDLPLLEHCQLDHHGKLEQLMGGRCAEISRLAVSRITHAGLREGAGTEPPQRSSRLVLGLYKAMYHASKLNEVRCWYAAMEPALAQLLRRLGMPFIKLGPAADYYGRVYPYAASVAAIEQSVRAKSPAMYQEFVRGLAPSP